MHSLQTQHKSKSQRRFGSAIFVVALSLLGSLISTEAYGQTSFTWTGNKTNAWPTAGNWTPTGGPPNAIDAVAIFNLGSTGVTANVNAATTVGSIVVNQPDSGAAALTIGQTANVLTFQTSTGDATFVNQLASGAVNDGTGEVKVKPPIQLNSPLDVTAGFNFQDNLSIDFSGGITGSVPLSLTGGGNLQISGNSPNFTGTIAINSGAVRISGNYLTGAGNVTVSDGGQFQIGSSTVTDWSLAPGSVIYINGLGKASGVNNVGALRFQNNSTATNFNTPVVLQTDAAIGVNGNLTGTPPTVGTLTITQPISGPGALVKNGTGVLVLANDNTYGTASPTKINGGTLVLADAKNDGGLAITGDIVVGNTTNTNPTVLQIGAAGQQLPASANVTLVASTAAPGNTGTFNLNGFNQTIGALNGADGGGLVQNNNTIGNSVLTINAATASSTYTGVIQDGITPGSGTLALAVTGAAPQSVALSGSNTYTGGTTVGNIPLIVNNTTGSATGTGAVTVNAGGTLAGAGIITGSVNFVGGTLAPSFGAATPAVPAPATLTLGATAFDAASTIHYQLGAPGTAGSGVNDLTVVNGDLTLAGVLNVNALAGFGAGDYQLFTYTGTLVDHGLSLGALPSGFTYTIDESTAGEVKLDVAAVTTLAGDANHDGVVNGLDIALVASNWLTTGTPGLQGDTNHDGVVNGLDIAQIASNWLSTLGGGAGFGASATASVPEPHSVWLASIGLGFVFYKARRRLRVR